jgi:hypothetical protein
VIETVAGTSHAPRQLRNADNYKTDQNIVEDNLTQQHFVIFLHNLFQAHNSKPQTEYQFACKKWQLFKQVTLFN